LKARLILLLIISSCKPSEKSFQSALSVGSESYSISSQLGSFLLSWMMTGCSRGTLQPELSSSNQQPSEVAWEKYALCCICLEDSLMAR
jgi:hypothetical protein